MKQQRARVIVRGAVQGVGFRPFVFRLATALKLNGWVLNSPEGVLIEIEGGHEQLCEFLQQLETEKPPAALIHKLDFLFLETAGYERFEIRESEQTGEKSVLISPDLATCADCLREILDRQNRRFRYPFTNCTNCGPRFSIIDALPYDRPNTAMKGFAMCAECEAEYHDPANRRFHAQPNACSNCGPQLELWSAIGTVLATRDDALKQAAEKIRGGEIVALKGLGGFQLLVDARNEKAVERLRERKQRKTKPLALLYPALNSIHVDCRISHLEEKLLCSSAAPIVLLEGRSPTQLARSVAPGNPWRGVMLPCSPLHHLLLRELGFPIVATSGNLSDEPICTDEHDALKRLGGIADFFLVHNRPITRHVDDSIGREMCGREMILRRARGYAPLPIEVNEPLPKIFAVGAHLKNSVALSVGNKIFLSQHIGDLQTKEAWSAFRKSAADLPQLYDATPEWIACDLHPDYLSTQHAAQMAQPRQKIQHHWAHVASCMAENKIAPPALGVSWDGTGYGIDGTIWGGEFLLANEKNTFQRVAHLRPFRLPGGDAAIKQPRRAALGLLHELSGPELTEKAQLAPTNCYSPSELRIIETMLRNGTNAPLTSSVGRLFDAVASLLDLCQQASFEGEAAMQLEFAITPGVEDLYSFGFHKAEKKTSNAECSQFDSPEVLDWEPMIRGILNGISHNQSIGMISAKFHNTLVEMIVATAQKIGEPKVILTGGCFQNKYLLERTVRRLREEKFSPFWHQQVPTNDGGIALGQVVAAAWARRK